VCRHHVVELHSDASGMLQVMFHMHIIHVEMSAAKCQEPAWTSGGAREGIPDVLHAAEAICSCSDLSQNAVHLHSIALEDIAGSSVPAEEGRAELRRMLRSIRDATARLDAVRSVRSVLLRREADRHGCNKLLQADCMDSAAAAFISSLAKVRARSCVDLR
jgi:hypothetical protein